MDDLKRQKVFDRLDAYGIRYTHYEHPEVRTVEAASRYKRDDGSTACKNLLLRNRRGDRYYLVCLDAARRLDLHALAEALQQGRLSFASERELDERLGVAPGAVSPFGLLNDPTQQVRLLLDEHLSQVDAYSFHPNDSRSTIVIARTEFLRYLARTKQPYEFIRLC